MPWIISPSPANAASPRAAACAQLIGTPAARGDLESLQRLTVEQLCAAFGVPADLVTNGRFAGKSTAQMALLNTTVSELAKTLNRILTTAYTDIYGDGNGSDPIELSVITSPLAATDEVAALYAAGLAPLEIAMPAALNAIGATRAAIDAAVKRAVRGALQLQPIPEPPRANQAL